ncbi:MAG: hypothetical protein ACLR56_15090 [Oscillospiraceae bacterium]
MRKAGKCCGLLSRRWKCSDISIKRGNVLLDTVLCLLSPQQYKNAGEIIEQLLPHISDISYRTYYRKRRDAISSLSCILWGYTERESLEVTKKFLQNK